MNEPELTLDEVMAERKPEVALPSRHERRKAEALKRKEGKRKPEQKKGKK